MYSRLARIAREQLLFFVSIIATVTVTVTVSVASTETCPPKFTNENVTDIIAGNNITLYGTFDDMVCKDDSQDMYLTVYKNTSSGIIHVPTPVNSSGWLDINCNIGCLIMNSEHITLYNLSITVFVVLSGRNTSVTTESTFSISPTTPSQSPSTTLMPSQPPSVTSPTASGIYKLYTVFLTREKLT